MNGKLFIRNVLITVILASVQVLVCHAEDILPAAEQAKAQDRFVPDHEIKYEEKLSPDWKTNWDIARSLYRDKKYPEALVQYEMLLAQKENIEEARWEYVSILIYLKRWEAAKVGLEKLLATEPESNRYRLAMATVSIETGNIENGVGLYDQLLGEATSEADTVAALEGLIRGREALGQKDKAAALLEQLISLKPQDRSLLLKQAAFELEIGNTAKAKELCSKYDQSGPQDIAVLALHAYIEERLNNNAAAAAYWRQVIALDPDNAEAHRHLYMYYFSISNWAMSFHHLEPLVKKTPSDVSLLERAAVLNMQLGRIDHALEYYEYGLAVDPVNQTLIDGKKKAQKILARDMLILVENDGNKKLWQDLGNVAPDSAGIYREMANLLRAKGKVDELLEVLIMLNKQVPEDEHVYDELASMLEKQGYLAELSALRASRTGKDDSGAN